MRWAFNLVIRHLLLMFVYLGLLAMVSEIQHHVMWDLGGTGDGSGSLVLVLHGKPGLGS